MNFFDFFVLEKPDEAETREVLLTPREGQAYVILQSIIKMYGLPGQLTLTQLPMGIWNQLSRCMSLLDQNPDIHGTLEPYWVMSKRQEEIMFPDQEKAHPHLNEVVEKIMELAKPIGTYLYTPPESTFDQILEAVVIEEQEREQQVERLQEGAQELFMEMIALFREQGCLREEDFEVLQKICAERPHVVTEALGTAVMGILELKKELLEHNHTCLAQALVCRHKRDQFMEGLKNSPLFSGKIFNA